MSKKITNQDIEEIKRLAGEATPEPLFAKRNRVQAHDDGGMRVGAWPHIANFTREADAEFHAATDPQTILALIEWGEAWREAALTGARAFDIALNSFYYGLPRGFQAIPTQSEPDRSCEELAATTASSQQRHTQGYAQAGQVVGASGLLPLAPDLSPDDSDQCTLQQQGSDLPPKSGKPSSRCEWKSYHLRYPDDCWCNSV